MDTGLHSLVAIARFHQLPHQLGVPGEYFSDTDILLALKTLTLKVKLISPSPAELTNDLLPAIFRARDGSYFVVV